MTFPEALRDEQLNRFADQLLAPVAEQLFGLLVDEDDLSLAPYSEDCIGNELKEMLKG
jgi:hypothetical protein